MRPLSPPPSLPLSPFLSLPSPLSLPIRPSVAPNPPLGYKHPGVRAGMYTVAATRVPLVLVRWSARAVVCMRAREREVVLAWSPYHPALPTLFCSLKKKRFISLSFLFDLLWLRKLMNYPLLFC